MKGLRLVFLSKVNIVLFLILMLVNLVVFFDVVLVLIILFRSSSSRVGSVCTSKRFARRRCLFYCLVVVFRCIIVCMSICLYFLSY